MPFRCTKACFIHKVTKNISDILWAMSENEFSTVFRGLFLLYEILMKFIKCIQFKDILQCYSRVIEYFASYWKYFWEITF